MRISAKKQIELFYELSKKTLNYLESCGSQEDLQDLIFYQDIFPSFLSHTENQQYNSRGKSCRTFLKFFSLLQKCCSSSNQAQSGKSFSLPQTSACHNRDEKQTEK